MLSFTERIMKLRLGSAGPARCTECSDFSSFHCAGCMKTEKVPSIFLKMGWVGRKDSVTDRLLFTIRWLSHLSLNTQVKRWRACGSKNTHLPRNGREVVGETSRDFMPWGYKLEDKDGARDLAGDPAAMLTGPRDTAIA